MIFAYLHKSSRPNFFLFMCIVFKVVCTRVLGNWEYEYAISVIIYKVKNSNKKKKDIPVTVHGGLEG